MDTPIEIIRDWVEDNFSHDVLGYDCEGSWIGLTCGQNIIVAFVPHGISDTKIENMSSNKVFDIADPEFFDKIKIEIKEALKPYMKLNGLLGENYE